MSCAFISRSPDAPQGIFQAENAYSWKVAEKDARLMLVAGADKDINLLAAIVRIVERIP
jgi:hypothetical protein